MRKIIAAVTMILVAVLVFASPVAAFVGGGRKPSEAPLIVSAQHYTGELNNHKSDANYNGSHEVAFWRLPSLETHDLIVVSWHELPFAHSSDFPVRMIMTQNVNDFSWGSVFSESYWREDRMHEVSGSGSAETEITAQEANANASYLEFYSNASRENSPEFESYPYDFTVSGPLHYLSAAISPVSHIRVNGTLHATVSRADGSPAPDGLSFNLNVSKDGESIASYAAMTRGGQLGFPLTLPETLVKEDAEFAVSRAADSTYQSVESAKLDAQLAKPAAPSPSPCPEAKRRAHALSRQLKRLKRHARVARGFTRRRLRRRVRHVGRELRVAHMHAASVCGSS